MMKRSPSSEIAEINLISRINPAYLDNNTTHSLDVYLVLDLHYHKKMDVTYTQFDTPSNSCKR